MVIKDAYGFRKADVYFNEPVPDLKTDIIEYHQWSEPVPGSLHQVFHTRVLDLSKSEEELWNEIDNDTRKEIRRARNKDGFQYEHWSDSHAGAAVELIAGLHNEFVAYKGIAAIDPADFHRLARSNALDLSLVRSAEGEPLAWRTYMVIAGRARAMRVGSTRMAATTGALRQQIGRASRLLLWENVLRFRSRGLRIYDHGGWYAGNSDAEKQSINRFKAEFGGSVVQEFNSLYGRTAAGALLVRCLKTRNVVLEGNLMRNLLRRVREIRGVQPQTGSPSA